ncbi:MAG: IS30 family transposase, partial [Akkermansiaceae bacterium]|nr:IS30 family transposase [Akkermansiaceae bacterium]
ARQGGRRIPAAPPPHPGCTPAGWGGIPHLFNKSSALPAARYNSKKKKRTKVYFAHPYSSFERGSNENANRLIRRFLPKGSTFDELSQRVVQRLARWMNKIPRKLFDGKSANEMVKALGLNFGDAKH